MKFVKIFIILSLVIFSFARITKTNNANLKSTSKSIVSNKASSSSKSKDVLQKPYTGVMKLENGKEIQFYLNAYELESANPKGINFRYSDDDSTIDASLRSLLEVAYPSVYYLPYRSLTTIHFVGRSFELRDSFETTLNGKKLEYKFEQNSWTNGSGESLIQKLNQFRSRKVNSIVINMKTLSRLASGYVAADTAIRTQANLEVQIKALKKSICDRTTLREANLKLALAFPIQITPLQTELADLRKQLISLNAANKQKRGLIDELTSAIDDLNKQKTSNSKNSDQFKTNMDASSSNFIRILALLKIEVVSDADKVDAVSDALLKTNNLDSCLSILKTIMP